MKLQYALFVLCLSVSGLVAAHTGNLDELKVYKGLCCANVQARKSRHWLGLTGTCTVRMYVHIYLCVYV